MRASLALSIEEASQVGDARRTLQHLAVQTGFGEDGAGKAALIATELATNLVKHAQGGELVCRQICELGARGIEMLALDRGRGMRNVTECLRDGYSTSGSPGTGLGAIQRLAHAFELYSVPGAGTALLARLWLDPPASGSAPGFALGAVNVARPGESVCGDSWAVEQAGASLYALVADGLGHGMFAAEAAEEAVRMFGERRAGSDLTTLMSWIDGALRKTRGAAVGLAELDTSAGLVRYAGVGNIAGTIVTPGAELRARAVVSTNGTVGGGMRKVQEYAYPWEAGSLLILHSDGLRNAWRLENYPGLLQRDPALIAGILYRDYRRKDDVTVLALRAGRA